MDRIQAIIVMDGTPEEIAILAQTIQAKYVLGNQNLYSSTEEDPRKEAEEAPPIHSLGFREARVNAGVSVRDVMAEMGVTDAAVYQRETGVTRPRTSMLMKLANLYNCTVDELLREDKTAVGKE